MSKSDEPVFSVIPTGIQMTEAFNYYAMHYSWRDSRNFQVVFLKKKNMMSLAAYISKAEDVDLSWVAGWICRMIDNGSKVTSDDLTYLGVYLERIENLC